MTNFDTLLVLLALVCLSHGAIEGGKRSDEDDAMSTTLAITTITTITTKCADNSKSENCGQPEVITEWPGNGVCKRNNERCLVHSNCCSGICSNFHYLCVAATTQLATLGTGGQLPNKRWPDSRPQCKITGQRCDVSDQCCSRSCFLQQCVYTPGLDTPSGVPFPSSSPRPAVTNAVILSNRIGDTGTPTKCFAIGEKCDGHDQCCSKNCLFFSHQCVYPAALTAPSGSISQLAPPSASELANRFGETTTCQQVGERCDAHDQCCSKNCLTFLRRCVQPASLQVVPGALSPTSIPSTTPDDVLIRFGDNGCSAVGERCVNHNQCCSKNCLLSYRQCIYPAGNVLSLGNVPTILPMLTNVNQIMNRFDGSVQPKCQEIGDRCSSHDECCSRNCLRFTQKCVYQAGLMAPAGQNPLVIPQSGDSLTNRFEAATAPTCKNVGEKCFAHEECCSKNCLHFMHQCVQPAGLRPETSGTVVASRPNNNSIVQPTKEPDVGNRFEGSSSGVCKKNGDECLDHAECCSGNCLNFLRQCVSNTHPVAPRDPAVYTLRPPFSPFPPSMPVVPSVISLNEQHRNLLDCRRNGLKCAQDNECCSLTCDGNTNVCTTQRANQNFNQGNGGVNNNNNVSRSGDGGKNNDANNIRKVI